MSPTEQRTPQWLTCDTCQHAWVGMYLPIDMALWSRLARAARCPMCGAKPRHVYEGGITPDGHRSPQVPSPIYFRTVEDFHQLPEEKLRACLEDFFLWLVMCRVLAPGLDGIVHVKDTSTFGWVDDGRHDANFRIELTPAPTSLTTSLVDRDGAEHSRTWSAEELAAAPAQGPDWELARRARIARVRDAVLALVAAQMEDADPASFDEARDGWRLAGQGYGWSQDGAR